MWHTLTYILLMLAKIKSFSLPPKHARTCLSCNIFVWLTRLPPDTPLPSAPTPSRFLCLSSSSFFVYNPLKLLGLPQNLLHVAAEKAGQADPRGAISGRRRGLGIAEREGKGEGMAARNLYKSEIDIN